MTVKQAIDFVDKLKPNQYEESVKIGWLSKLDGMIFEEVFLTHADSPAESFSGYTSADKNKKMLVPYPYDEDIYNYFLQSQIDKENAETNKYNQSHALYNNAYKAFCDWYYRKHRPLPERAQFLF